jgi:hypothetical protein
LRLSPGEMPADEPDLDLDEVGSDDPDDESDNGSDSDEATRVLDHVKALRRRVAGFN